MVTKHIQLQHSSGLYDKIKNLETPEDIQKWREERKRRYPTRKNVEQRQQAQAERTKRGELLGDSKSRFGHQRDRRGAPQFGDKQSVKPTKQPQHVNKSKRRRQRKPISTLENDGNDCCDGGGSDGDEVNGKMFRGTSTMDNYRTTAVTAAKVQNALSCLVGMYASDSDDNDSDDSNNGNTDAFIISEHLDAKKEIQEVSVPEMQQIVDETAADNQVEAYAPNVAAATELNVEIAIVEDEANDDGDNEAPEEQPVQRMTELPPADPIVSSTNCQAESTDSKPRKRQRKRNGPTSSNNESGKKPKPTTLLDLSKRYRNQNTMLEKLLQKDIRHERNVLLQCVRHVVQNRFFGIGSENKKSTAAEQSTTIDLPTNSNE